jgi:hypothetical protein
MINRIWLAGIVAAASLWAQDIPLDIFSSLISKASEHVEVTLDKNMIQFAAGFLSDRNPQTARVKALVAGLQGIYVRSLSFDKPGAYSRADVQKIQSQLKGWNKIVEVHEAGEDTGIYVKTDGQKIQGVVIVAAEANELTLVNIVGTLRLEDLKDLSGQFGIPDVGDVAKQAAEKKKEEE